MRILKMCLKQLFSHSKWVLQAIFFQTVLSISVLAVQTLTPLFYLTVANLVMFFRLLDRKFYEDSKNVIFSLQVGLTSNFVLDYQIVLKSSSNNQGFEKFLAVLDAKRVSEIISFKQISILDRPVNSLVKFEFNGKIVKFSCHTFTLPYRSR